MAASFDHEPVQMLDEFVSDGWSGTGFIPGPRVTREGATSHGLPPVGVSTERIAELRKALTIELLVLLNRRAPALSAGELQVIHDIAAERSPRTSEEIALMRAVMCEAVTRLMQ
jgi:hypothetical protein